MTIAEKNIDKINKVVEEEFNSLSLKIFQSFLVTKTHKIKTIEDKDALIDSFIDFLNKYIETDLVKNNKDRLSFLNLIDKLILQKELLQLRRKELSMTDIKKAGARLGKKSQSAFINK